MTEMVQGDRFRIRLWRNYNSFVGYIQHKTVQNLLGPEYVLVQGSVNKEDATVFIYDGSGYISLATLYPTFIVELPYQGEYIAYIGQGEEFNALKVGTTEYNSGKILSWSINTFNDETNPLYNVIYSPENILNVNIGVLTKPIRIGAHARRIDPGQLRFGYMGSPTPVGFEFELI